MSVTLVVDFLIAVLLVATIAYSWMLNRKLGMLRADRAALDQTALRFTEAASRAELAVADLKGASTGSGRVLEDTVKRATTLRDDLAYLIERGEAIAAKLDAARLPVSVLKRPASPAHAPAPIQDMRPSRATQVETDGAVTDNPARTLQELKQALANLR
jgi:Domain of unknown function (DUF6468)